MIVEIDAHNSKRLISLIDFGPKLGYSSYYGSLYIRPNRLTIVIVQIGSELLRSLVAAQNSYLNCKIFLIVIIQLKVINDLQSKLYE